MTAKTTDTASDCSVKTDSSHKMLDNYCGAVAENSKGILMMGVPRL